MTSRSDSGTTAISAGSTPGAGGASAGGGVAGGASAGGGGLYGSAGEDPLNQSNPGPAPLTASQIEQIDKLRYPATASANAGKYHNRSGIDLTFPMRRIERTNRTVHMF